MARKTSSLPHFLLFLIYGTGYGIWVDALSPKVHGLNAILNPGEETCFYQYYDAGETIQLEYSVISASYQDHIIGFQLSDTYGRPILSEFKKTSSSNQFKTTTPGAYRVCFDNTHTRYSRKSVALHMTAQDATGIGTNWEQYNRSRLEPEEDYGGKVKEIVGLVDKVRVYLNDIQNSQEIYRQVELRDRMVAENNFDRVNWYSTLCVLCTVSVMWIQTLSLRAFFEQKSAVQRLKARLGGGGRKN